MSNIPLHTLYLSGGSNLGNRLEYLQQAERNIENKVGKLLKKSSVYVTSSWANNNEPAYLNIIWVIETILSPQQVLEAILQIENCLGRTRTQKWEPRIIDIDILFYDNQIVNEPSHLIIPHPYIQERKFWLIPLQSLCPNKVHPVMHETITQLLLECNDKGSVELFVAE